MNILLRLALAALLLCCAACTDAVTAPTTDASAPDANTDAPPPSDATMPADVSAPVDAPPDAPVDAPIDAPVDAATSLAFSRAVRVIVEPSDMGAALVAAIRGAQRSVHMTMYLLSAREVIAALTDARARGVEVQVLLNRAIPGGAMPNEGVFATLNAAGVSVRWSSSRFSFTHEKCVIVDGAEAWIMTMNTTGAGLDGNREFLAIDREPDDVRDAEAVFRADFVDAPFPSYTGRLVLSPINAQARLVALVRTATRTIDLESESLEDRTTAAALIERARAGVRVRAVISDTPPTASSMRTLADLAAAGVTVRVLATPYMHAKAIVVDGARAYAGSANVTYVSLTGNRELGVLFDDPAEVRRVADTLAADVTAGAPR